VCCHTRTFFVTLWKREQQRQVSLWISVCMVIRNMGIIKKNDVARFWIAALRSQLQSVDIFNCFISSQWQKRKLCFCNNYALFDYNKFWIASSCFALLAMTEGGYTTACDDEEAAFLDCFVILFFTITGLLRRALHSSQWRERVDSRFLGDLNFTTCVSL
jgi:hypothetical protein